MWRRAARSGRGLSTAIEAGVEEVTLYLQTGHGPDTPEKRCASQHDVRRAEPALRRRRGDGALRGRSGG